MSDPERHFAWQLTARLVAGFEREYQFHPTRRWRFDFAHPHLRIAVEIEGGVYSGGRHNTGKGFEADCEKYNEAARLGWRLFRFPSGWVKSCRAINYLLDVLNEESDET